MCLLRLLSSCLTLLYSTELFYSSMIFFDFPGLNTHIFSFLFIHIKHICSPVLCVFVFGNYPKYLCKTVFFEMYYSSLMWNLNCLKRDIFLFIRINQTI